MDDFLCLVCVSDPGGITPKDELCKKHIAFSSTFICLHARRYIPLYSSPFCCQEYARPADFSIIHSMHLFLFLSCSLCLSRLSQRPVFHWRSSSLRLIHGCLSSGVLGAQRAGWLAGCASVSILSLSSSLFLSLCLRVIAALLDMLFCFSVVLLFGLRVLFGLLAGLSRFGYQVLVLRAGLGWAGLG